MLVRAAVLVVGLGIAVACDAAGDGARWAAFAGPDIPQARTLFQDLQRRAAADPELKDLDFRFVPMLQTGDDENDRRMRSLVAQHPAVILALSTDVAIVAKRSGTTIPVVFASVGDPVRAGLIDSLAHPGGNLTGFTYDVPVEGKQLEILKELAPNARTVGVLEDGRWLGERVTAAQVAQYERESKVAIRVFRIDSAGAIAKVVLGRDAKAVDAWLVPISNTMATARREVVDAIRRSGKPAVFGRGLFVDAGGLASYQEVIDAPMELWQRTLRAILKGIPPSRIPVQRPKQFELAVNLATANRSGIHVPPSVLRRANRVVYE